MEKHLRVFYHTHIKALVREGLLSTSVLKQIPRSNLYRWRAESQEKYKDFGLILNAEKDYETLKSFAQDRSAKRIYAAYVRIISAVLSIAHSLTGFHQEIQAQRIQFVDLVNKVKNIVGLRKTLRILKIYQFTRSEIGRCNLLPNALSPRPRNATGISQSAFSPRGSQAEAHAHG